MNREQRHELIEREYRGAQLTPHDLLRRPLVRQAAALPVLR